MAVLAQSSDPDKTRANKSKMTMILNLFQNLQASHLLLMLKRYSGF